MAFYPCVGFLILLSFFFAASADFVSYTKKHEDDYQIQIGKHWPVGPVKLRCAIMQKRRAVAYETFSFPLEVCGIKFFVDPFNGPFRIRCNYFDPNDAEYGYLIFDSRAPYAEKCRAKNGGCVHQIIGPGIFLKSAGGMELNFHIPHSSSKKTKPITGVIRPDSLNEVQSEDPEPSTVGPPPVSI